MKFSIRNLALLPCLAAFVALSGTAHAGSISGTVWEGWSASVPTFSGLPSAGSAAATFTTNGLDFCSQVNIGSPAPCSGVSSAYTINGFLNSNGGSNGVSGVTFASGKAGTDTLDNTLWEFTGSAFFTNGQTFQLAHDDGAILYVGGTAAGNVVLSAPGPTSPTLSSFTYSGPTGIESFTYLYGETSGAPAAFDTTLGVPPAVPEPSSIVLLGSGLLAAAGTIRRRFSK